MTSSGGRRLHILFLCFACAHSISHIFLSSSGARVTGLVAKKKRKKAAKKLFLRQNFLIVGNYFKAKEVVDPQAKHTTTVLFTCSSASTVGILHVQPSASSAVPCMRGGRPDLGRPDFKARGQYARLKQEKIYLVALDLNSCIIRHPIAGKVLKREVFVVTRYMPPKNGPIAIEARPLGIEQTVLEQNPGAWYLKTGLKGIREGEYVLLT